MFLDASALTAILADEHDGPALAARISGAESRMTSPMALWETVVAVSRTLDLPVHEALATVRAFLALAEVQVVAVPPEAAEIAVDAFERYGKGRHPAALNFGDCFAYACARCYRQPLLYKGDDFARTDVEAA
ncbi:type II toxin-antitoxin system VapC family toxin [Methylopila sp. M107]|uniref:type II toxin-antitoxin system VapC family toxin n=1 Tax=Methylopila sp. M107 TaxID=1101190 RepID=UPI00037B17C8|nr:type II toxin-antitoxin system VapC family toxin [Methylopila sp. M107]